ncbi:hypothetical protein SAMN05428988_4193 [Chitinophaga sp. YR573]|uniref:hypothetical protein n=1 Tax=Chitinophaga sp. YR573 TaxID=1881040 RepID=UPI0008C10B66|nr:hypothetical protein [Chitinophaga sp. YR573]SEW34705.1 hypothetical protein SAMN05428988_4193 [Chitinophaga sp. YR573]
MTNSEKILAFKRLYVAAYTLCANTEKLISENKLNEQDVDKAITCMDEMIALLPISFPVNGMAFTSAALMINLKDPEDEPKETMVQNDGGTRYIRPENIVVVYESTLSLVLEDWKFSHWNYIVVNAQEKSSRTKYKPFMLEQAEKCLALIPLKDTDAYGSWMDDMIIVYSNQIGWCASEDEEDPVKLEKALDIVARGFKLSNWRKHKYIKETMTDLLLKLNRYEEAYVIVAEGLVEDADNPYFQHVKNDERYIRWVAAETQRKEEIHNAFLKAVSDEQAKETDQFIYPGHPLVQQHAAILNLIKQRMIAIRMRRIHNKIQKKEEVTDSYMERFELRKWSLQELEVFEETNDLQLPTEYKIYLMEIGSGGGGGYFNVDEISGIDYLRTEAIDNLKKPFPITATKIHDVGNSLGVKAWVYPDSEKWKSTGLFQEDMETLFGLPDKADITDGCMLLAYSRGQNELYLIGNGEFENEVWVDALQYGAEARGSFGAASSKRLKFLEFMAESLLSRWVGNENASDTGDWM